MCYTKVFHNKHSQSNPTVRCRAVGAKNTASLQCTGAEERRKKDGRREREVRQRACSATDQVRLLALMA